MKFCLPILEEQATHKVSHKGDGLQAAEDSAWMLDAGRWMIPEPLSTVQGSGSRAFRVEGGTMAL